MSDWVSVKDKLPPYDTAVLTYRGKYDCMQVDVLISDLDKATWCGTLCKDWEEVSHWMPLPKPPNENI
jgi:hypothetical protein